MIQSFTDEINWQTTKKSEHSRHLPEDRTIRTIRKNWGKIGGGSSFFRDFRTSLGGPLSFYLSLSLTRLHCTLYHPPGRCTSRHRVKSGRAIISPLTAFEVYILSRHLQASRERRGWGRSTFFLSPSPLLSPFISRGSSSFTRTCSYRQKRIRQKREGSACWIAEPRGVGARIKGAVRLEGAPNYDVTDRTRRDQVSRIQNGLLITESSSHPSDRHGGRYLLQPISASLCTFSLKGNICFLLKTWRHLNTRVLRSANVCINILSFLQIFVIQK